MFCLWAKATKMIIPSALQFTAERLMASAGRVGTADNDINAIRSMGMIPQGYSVNNFLTDTDAFFIITDVPNGMKHFVALAAIFKPLSSVRAAMSIIDCSNEVSFKSAAVANVLLKVPAIVG